MGVWVAWTSMFATVCVVLLAGYPVAFSLGGTALLFSLIGTLTGTFDTAFLEAMPNRLYGLKTKTVCLSGPFRHQELILLMICMHGFSHGLMRSAH